MYLKADDHQMHSGYICHPSWHSLRWPGSSNAWTVPIFRSIRQLLTKCSIHQCKCKLIFSLSYQIHWSTSSNDYIYIFFCPRNLLVHLDISQMNILFFITSSSIIMIHFFLFYNTLTRTWAADFSQIRNSSSLILEK